MEDGHKFVDPLLIRGGRGREERWGFFAVYDGHGGRKEVDYCEAKFHEVVLGCLRTLPIGSREVQGALVESFQKIDSQLAMLGAWDSGCTATVALVHRTSTDVTLHVANVGDSRAVVVSDTARRVSTDHRATDAAEVRRVTQDGGCVRHGRVGGRLSVSRSLGDHHLKSAGLSCVPDVCSLSVCKDRALLIASDGLWDALTDDEAHQVFDSCWVRANAQGGDPRDVASRIRESTARTMVERAKSRGSRDNILALVVLF